MVADTTTIQIRVDRSAPTPLYHQVAREIERAISDGRLVRGSYLDNELALTDQWQVSRLTLRRAIGELVESGLLVRRRGIGTQVVNDQLPRPVRLGSLWDDLVAQGRKPTTTVLTHERVVADDIVAEHLGLAPGSQVVHLERCRHVDGRRIAILRNWLSTAACGDIETAELVDSGLYEALRRRGIWPHTAQRRITARVAGPVDAALLGVAIGDPLLKVESVMQDTTGERIDVSHDLHDGSDYSLELTAVES